MRHPAITLCLCAAASLLAGCDVLGIETAPQIAARKEAEGMAIGSACRHAIRSVEDCFRSNPKAGKAAVFAGWKDMDQYMRDNQIVGMPTEIKPEEAETADEADAPEAGTAKAHKS
jgi:hypothetical protein